MIADSVRTIWCREFQRDDITVDDDFFALGGQSLIMVRIQGAFIEELGVEVPMDQMFLNPTVASISAYIESLDAVSHNVRPALSPGPCLAGGTHTGCISLADSPD